jgi:hypothetical protein
MATQNLDVPVEAPLPRLDLITYKIPTTLLSW